MDFGAVLADEMRLQCTIKNVVHQRTLSGARDAGNNRERADRNTHVDVFQIVLARATQSYPARSESATIFRKWD